GRRALCPDDPDGGRFIKDKIPMDRRSQALPPSQPSRRSSKRFAPDELRAFKRLLLRRRALLTGNVQKLEDEACRKGSEAAGDLSTMPLHPADIATDTQQQDMSVYFMENENGQLQNIEDALERSAEDKPG